MSVGIHFRSHYTGFRSGAFALSALTGTSFGIYTASIAGTSFYSMMRMAASSPVSITGLTLTVITPFLFTLLAITSKRLYLFLPISFWQTFSFAFCAFGICLEFGSAAWIICLLLQFKDYAAMLMLHFFWVRHFPVIRANASRQLWLCAVLCFTISLIDYFIISPFLLRLFH